MSAKVVWCCWCRSLHVTPGRADDHLTVMIAGEVRVAILNGEQIVVADGVCPPCSEKVKKQPESPAAAAAIVRPEAKL